jgi:hypothetical protein
MNVQRFHYGAGAIRSANAPTPSFLSLPTIKR